MLEHCWPEASPECRSFSTTTNHVQHLSMEVSPLLPKPQPVQRPLTAELHRRLEPLSPFHQLSQNSKAASLRVKTENRAQVSTLGMLRMLQVYCSTLKNVRSRKSRGSSHITRTRTESSCMEASCYTPEHLVEQGHHPRRFPHLYCPVETEG